MWKVRATTKLALLGGRKEGFVFSQWRCFHLLLAEYVCRWSKQGRVQTQHKMFFKWTGGRFCSKKNIKSFFVYLLPMMGLNFFYFLFFYFLANPYSGNKKPIYVLFFPFSITIDT